jgi:hypothetical protein
MLFFMDFQVCCWPLNDICNDFNKKPDITPPRAPEQPHAPVSTPQGLNNPDGVYLVNSLRGNERSSGLAYYKNMRFGGNDGQQPDDYTDIVHGSLLDWSGHHTGTETSF